MASITSLRVRPLSEKGRQLLEDKVSWFNQKLLCIKSDIDSLIRSVDGRDMNVEEVRKNLLESLKCYEDISINFVCFLETQRSLESDREKVSHLLVRDTLRSKVQKCLLDLKQLDIKIKQRTSSVSSTTSDLRRKKYELNAARAKVKHVELELQEIMRQKKELDARMSLLAVKQEEIKLETEVQELEDLELSNSSVSDSLPLFKYEQISNFDIRNCEHDRNICVDIGFIPPPVEFQDCESVFEKVADACDVPVLNNITNINSETMTSVPNLSNPTLHHYVNSVIAPANSFDRLPYISSYQKSKASLYKDIYPIPVPPVATPRKDNFPLTYVSDISGSLDNVPSTCKNNSIPLQNSGKIQFMPTRNIMNETYSVHSSSEPDNQSNDSSSQVEMCKLMTQMMARKDIVLTRLVKYDDSPMHYVSWKQTFKDVINELGVNDAEELDLLLRWLGPASAKQAASIKASCGGNLLEALKKVWDRLEIQYGAPELIEEHLKNKLSQFPKLTNSNSDSKRLFELYDLLCEINSVKNDTHYNSLFSYYDSCIGINQVVSHLPTNLQEKWSNEVNKYKRFHGRVYPPFTFFIDFIYDMARWRTDPSLFRGDPHKSRVGNRPSPLNIGVKKTELMPAGEASKPAPVCPVHGTKHTLNQCREFRTKPMEERMDLLKKFKICFRCCGVKKHLQKKCTEKIKCDVCKSIDHPSALHQTNSSNTLPKVLPSVSPSQFQIAGNYGGESSELSNSCTQICGIEGGAGKSCAKIMPALVYPEGKSELAQKVYVVIDDQSNHSLATPGLLDTFKEDGGYVNFLLSTCSGKFPTVGRVTKTYTVEALDHSLSIRVPSLIECSNIPNDRREIPSPEVAKYYPHLKDLTEFIPPVDSDIGIEVLIGRDVIQAHFVLDQRYGGPDVPYAQKLPLGWVIIGETCLGKVHKVDAVDVFKTTILHSGRASSCFSQCENHMFVKSEPIFKKTPLDETLGLSIEDGMFLDLMGNEMKLDEDGHWTAPLPFCLRRPVLPSNREQALQRVKSLDHSLKRDAVKKEHLLEFMQKMIDKGHAEIAPPITSSLEHWYLPFFGIYHPKKPGSIRVVFDSSAKCNGICLNDVLMTGPDLTNSLLGVLLRFRKEAIAITADVEQMFYNFRVMKTHRNFLRFIWHKDNDLTAPLIDYQMTVHVFGNSPSPSIATYALRRSVGQADQDVRDFVCRNFYVDDGLTSCVDNQTAVDLMKRTQKALEDGGKLRLHKIVSNSKAVLQSFDSIDLAKDLKDMDLSSDLPPIQRSLGLSWDISSDNFIFIISSEQKPFTKRGILSTINSIFDPLGVAAPVTLCGKLLLREITSCSGPIKWDEELPETTKRRWEDWVTSLKSLEGLRIPRKFSQLSFASSIRAEVHIFSDASKEAIASVAYIRLFKDDCMDVAFLMGKAKVAPQQGHTIPRLELCAAVLSVEIADIVKKELDIDPSMFYFYTDSKIVLGYLSNETRRFYVYVANRVGRIRASSSPHQWYFVSTEENPADIASRGLNAVNLPNSTYLCGPCFLRQNIPIGNKQFPLVMPDTDKEVRPEIQSAKTGILQSRSSWTERFSRFSTWNSLVRAFSLIKTVIRKRQNKDRPTRLEVEQDIIRIVQHEVFPEVMELKANKDCPCHSDLSSLSPFLDHKEVLRVGGRLKHAKELGLCLQPVIIPKKHHISVLLVRHYHQMNHHQGRHITEGALRSAGYWIIGSKRLVPAIVRQCIQCKRLRGYPSIQKMADLPVDRLTPGPPFTFVGIDTFGPWPVVVRKTRGGSASHKRWALLFTCLVSRAIHIEVIEELSSSSFINAFRRFIAIRGPVKLIRSDRGTNFVGSIEELGIQAEFVENGLVDKALSKFDTLWKFNPPHASHFGGSWERMIGICRRILDNMLFQEKNKLTHEVLCTLMAEVCTIVNSRPLTFVSADPQDPDILSPSRILTHKIPQQDICFPKFGSKDMLKSQWKLVQGLADEFWNRWSRDYIHDLQVRRKWKLPSENIKPGNVVVLRDKDVPRIHWPLAVVDRVFESEDGIVRKAEVRTTNQVTVVVFITSSTQYALINFGYEFKKEEFEGEKNFKLVRDFQNGCQVRSIAFCPDTAYRLPETVDQLRFVTAGIDKKLRIFTSDIVNKDTVKVLDGHTDFINDVACNPANDDIFYLASTSDDLTCKLWSSNGEESARFQLGAPGMSVCIHEREHRKLMVAQKNGIIKIFSLDLQQQILSLDCGVVPLMSADWSRHDDVIIAAAAGTEWLLFHSSNSSYPLERRQAHTEGTKEIKWSKSHPTLLATLGRPGRQIKVFSTRHNQVPLNTSLQVAYGLSWHHSLPVLAVGGDQKVHLFAIDPNRSQSAT